MAQIGINAHLLAGSAGYRQAGIHHYIKQVLNHLPHQNTNAFTVFVGDGAAAHLGNRLLVEESRWPTERPIVRIAWEQTVWPLRARLKQLDLLHSMAFVTPLASTVPKIVTVYDLSFYKFPDRFTRFKRLYLQSQTRRSCLNAVRVVTISRSGKQDVHELLGVPLTKIDVVEPGVDGSSEVLPEETVTQFKREKELTNPFILHVGTLQPRKNITVLIEAFAELNHPTLELVLVGGKGWLYEDIFKRVQTLGLEKRVRFTGYVPDEELPLWYNAAAVLALPSVYEGFGMPIAQAMACGTPVVASNVSAMPEVVGEAGFLFDPQNSAMLADRIGSIIEDSAIAADLRARGLEQARKFSWKQSGEKMANSYQRALQEVAQ